MGGLTLWCGFCGGPFENTREGWLEAVEDWVVPSKKELSFTPPPAPTEDIVTITQEDGEFWSEVVCVARIWDNYVSPRGTVENKFGTIAFPDYSIEPEDNDDPRLIMHPHCLSFLCRRINASPEQIWNSVYGPRSDYFKKFESKYTPNGLLKELEYYDIDGFHDDYFHYCIQERTLKKGRGKRKTYDHWKDPDSMKKLQWLFARPTVFPAVSSLSPTNTFGTPSSTSQAPCTKIFNIAELLDIIIDRIIGPDIPQPQLTEEPETFTSSSTIQSTKTIFALLQVNKSLYTTILRDRQTLFLRLAWMHGWMLPFTPQDWHNWANGPFHDGTVFKVGHNQDWRTYLLTFLRKEDVHVRNRWRFHKMAVQFGRGRSTAKLCWRSEVGDVGFRPDLKPFKPWLWERGGGEGGEEREEVDEVRGRYGLGGFRKGGKGDDGDRRTVEKVPGKAENGEENKGKENDS